MKLGILDFGNNEKLSGPEILKNVIEYAHHADINGFSRFWLTEHHSPNLGWCNPEMLLPVLASSTKQIKIGFAGTLASVHSPYRIACGFKLLSTLYPTRIDLGFANGRPSLEIAKLLLNRKYLSNKIFNGFENNVRSICNFLKKEKTSLISPYSSDAPEMWLLGTSYHQLPLALEMKIGFSRSLFHRNNLATENIDLLFKHKELFIAEHRSSSPLSLAFSGICDSDSQRATQRFYEIHKFAYSPKSNYIVGSPAYFYERLGMLQEETGIDEFIFNDLDRNNRNRIKTLSDLSNIIDSGF